MRRYFSTFIGIPLPKNILEEYNRLLDEIRPKSKLFDLANRYTPHITLSFFGERSEAELVELDALLEESLESFKDAKIKIAGLDQFSPESPRVVFLEIDSKELLEPRKLLKEKIPIEEEKEFHPHLTIFRLRSEEAQKEFQKVLPEIEDLVKKIDWQFPVEELAIYGVDKDWPREGQKIIYRHKV